MTEAIYSNAGLSKSSIALGKANERSETNRLGYGLFVLATATLFLRPGDLYPEYAEWPIYLVLILASLAASLSAVLMRLRWEWLWHNPAVFCVLLLLPAIALSHLSHGDFWSARMGVIDFSKNVVYFLLLVSLVDTLPRLRQFLALTAFFILLTAVLSVLAYHEIIYLPGIETLQRDNGVDASTGDATFIQQLQGCGIFSDPNDFATILVTAILIAVYFLVELKGWLWRLLLPMPTLLLLYTFAMTKSRGGFLSLLAGLGGFLVARFGLRRSLLIGAVLFPLLIVAFGGRQTEIDVTDKDDTAQGRMLLWRDGLVLFKQSPLFGNGYNTYADEVGQVAHNSFVHAYAELGLFGGTLFLAAFLVPIKSIMKLKFSTGNGTLGLQPLLFAILLAYAVGVFSLSRVYSTSTYLELGIGCALCAIAAPSNLQWMTWNSHFVRRIAIASVMMVIFIDGWIRIFV